MSAGHSRPVTFQTGEETLRLLTGLVSVTDANRNAAASLLVWNAKLGSDNLINNDEVITLSNLTYTLGDVNTTAGTQTITIGGTVGNITDADTTGDQSKYSTAVNGRVVTVTYVNAGAETITVTITGQTYSRTITFSYASAAAATDMTTATFTSNSYA